jgi:hypothetical protein
MKAKIIEKIIVNSKTGKETVVRYTIDEDTGKPILSQKKRDRRAKGFNHLLIGSRIKEKGKIQVGYLHIFKSVPQPKDVTFARLHQIKLTPYLNIYSKYNGIGEINKILNDRHCWPFDNELKYLKYEYVETIKIYDKLLKIRKACSYEIEKRNLPDFINNENTIVYTCFTTLNYLKYLSKKYRVQAWAFTDKKSKPEFLLKDITHYNKLIKKGKVIVTDPVVARQCLRLRESQGHRTEFIYDKTLIPKCATKHKEIRKPSIVIRQVKVSFENDPFKQKLVCITDGISVHRLKQYKADKIVARFPRKITFCSKILYQEYLEKLREGRVKKLSVQGCAKNGKWEGKGVRKDRRSRLQKRRFYSRHYREQYVTGQWLPENNYQDGVLYPLTDIEKDERFYRTLGSHKRILHHVRPHRSTTLAYNPANRKKAIEFEKVEKIVPGIEISKFPYNKPICVIYTDEDKDGIVHTHKVENVKMQNKKIILEDGEDTVVLCSVKDVDKWVHQEDYSHDNDRETKWIPYVSIQSHTVTTYKRPINSYRTLPTKIKKKKKWRSPIKGVPCPFINT